jgi:DNA processing protein
VTIAITTLLPGGTGFPERLTVLGWRRELRVRGSLNAGPAVAVVGARAASGVGMARAHAIGKHLATAGVHVVSGGALGIDGAAHRGALDGGGTTTVVLGSGLGIPYPLRHAPLFDQIVARGGALVSLLADDTEPRPWAFPARNPLISGLADLVVVIEAELRSGSLGTARAAIAQGRLVAAWPGSPGTDGLIAAGAALVETPADVSAALVGMPRYPAPVELDPASAAVQRAIAGGATGIDSIVRVTGLSVRAVLRALPSRSS